MSVVRWVFDDPVSLDTYTFEINPNAGGSPDFAKKFTYSNTSAPQGKTIIFQGQSDPQAIEFSGTILNEDQYNAFRTWWQKNYQVKITDDLARQFSIVIESFTPVRVRSATLPWKHTYTVKAKIVEWL